MKRLLALAALALAVPAGLALAMAPAASAAGEATVSVVHGIPDTPVNVFVDGKAALKNFKPGTVAGPLALPAGPHTVTVFPASDKDGSGDPVIKAKATLDAGKNYSLVAHLTAAGKPTLTPYVNDVSKVAAGKARLVVSHDAAAPAVDVRANGAVAFKGLENPKQASADLPAGTIKADVVLSGTDTVVIGPANLKLAEGTSTIVYAIGSAKDKTLALVVQTIEGLHSAPGGVPSGTGGLLEPAGPSAGWVLAGLLSVAALLVGGLGTYRSVRTNR